MLLDLESKNRTARDATGAALFGHDSSKWPAIWLDVVETITACRADVENRLNEALSQ